MLSHFGKIATCLLLAASAVSARGRFHQSSPRSIYTEHAIEAIETLQSYYNETTGRYETIGWWNAANCITTLADFTKLDPTDANRLGLFDVFPNSYTNAQSYHDDFLNVAYDDEGWWAMALIHSYDVTGTTDFLTMAQSIFEDINSGADDICGGGTYWEKTKTYKNAIANELYLFVAASLANRASNHTEYEYYYEIATSQWAWFRDSGMINSDNLINDGLTINSDGTCTNNGQTTWTYNQGTILGALVELVKAGGNRTELYSYAKNIATAAMTNLSTNGILHESCEDSCDSNAIMFKGIFLRNLHYLYNSGIDSFTKTTIKNFIFTNADAVWSYARFSDNSTFGEDWSGPPDAGTVNAGTENCGLDALVAAIAAAG
ncbi:glycoside hydrolase [Lipomyces oligophaga]|uniref:glycoside hydrolase n=1 Tax=Lipomyces oligophaga TaxID=45792 RepID=UPI0034CE2E51